MCTFFMVLKLLMLKILLFDLRVLNAAARYDYGYHPSAEEYDNLLRETGRYWTHAFLKAERDHLFMKPPTLENRPEFSKRYFMPKFQYEYNEPKKFNEFKQSSSSMKPPTEHLQNIGSSLEFNYYSGELPKPLFTTFSNTKPTSVTTTIKPIKSNVLVKPLEKPNILKSQKNAIKILKGNNTQESLPIYFTNPATGIIYAITELGKSPQNFTTTNGTIPIFITKEQYERDIIQIKSVYEKKCQSLRIITTPATPILRLQQTLASATRPTAAKFTPAANNPKPLKHPLPVVVRTALTVKDKTPATKTPRPLRKKKNKLKPKPKIKKQKPPGHKTFSTTLRPILANQPNGPAIILGTRTLPAKPNKNNEKIPTQLEKPNFENIFSGTAITPAARADNHRVSKRSIEKQEESSNRLAGDENLKQKIKYKNWKIQVKSALKNLKKKSNFFAQNASEHKKRNNTMKAYDMNSTEIKYLKPDSKEKKKILDKLQKILSKNLKNKKKFSAQNISKNFKNFKEYHNDLKISNKTFSKYKEIPSKLKKYLKAPQFTNHIFIKPTIDENDYQALQGNNLNTSKHDNSTEEFLTLTSIKVLKPLNLTSKNLQDMKNTSVYKSWKTESEIENGLNTFKSNEHEKQSTQTHENRLKNKSWNSFPFKDFKHHINKRSTEVLTKTNATNETLNISNKYVNPNHFRKGQNLNLSNFAQLSNASAINSTETTKANGEKTLKHLRKRKKLSKIKSNNSRPLETASRSSKRGLKKKKKIQKKSQGKQETDYYIFDMEDSYEEDDDNSDEEEYEDDDEDEDEDEEAELVHEQEDYDEKNEILAYDDEPDRTYTSEAGLSVEDLKEKVVQQVSSPTQKYNENNSSDLTDALLKHPLLDYDNDKGNALKPEIPYVRKRFRRRPPQLEINDDYDYDDDDDDNSITSNFGGFFRMIFYPIQVVVSSVMDSFGGKDASEYDNDNSNPYTKYTSYHKTLKQQHSSDEYDDDYDSNESSSSSFSSWLSSWFSFNRRNKKIGSTTVAPVKLKPTKASSSWLPSWLTFGANDRISTETASNEDYDEYDKWFASWFGQMRPKARKRTTTTTSTTTQIPHVPILTIVDPMKNPQHWIGILAHHIINHTSTSTANPLKDIWNKVTTTTTENPEIPRKVSYDKYQIWRLKPQDDNQVKALEEYKKSEDGIKLQWLKGPSLRGLTDVLVPPKMLVDFQASLTFELIDHEVLIFDVGKAIAYEKTKDDYFFTTTQKPKKNQAKYPIASMTWRKYYEYDDIIKYLETMCMRFPHLVELIHIGRSYEGRPLIVTKIESREAAAVNSAHYTAHQLNKLRHKKRIGVANAVFIEAGTHGTEWIGPATATWIINELLRIMKRNVSDDQSFIRNTTWYIMPVLNPDGYVYSHEYDRFWKKSRSRHVTRPSGILSSAMTWLQKKRAKEKVCLGVDLDRNWHYQWGRRGSSKSACNEFYAGPSPFSEPETKALSEFLMDYRTQIKLFVSMQSYGQIISYPYKANTTYDSERLDDMLDVAMVGTDGLRKKGSKSRYKIDSSNDLVENRSGCSDAFAAYEVGIPFTYTLQLADNGVHGYLLPSASIEPTAKDSFEIITGMLDYI